MQHLLMNHVGNKEYLLPQSVEYTGEGNWGRLPPAHGSGRERLGSLWQSLDFWMGLLFDKPGDSNLAIGPVEYVGLVCKAT